MDISNKTLAMFLVAAIVVSIAGTTISLNRLDSMGTGPTGFATDSDAGNVTVTVGQTLAISIDGDSEIDFGSCTITSYLRVASDNLSSETACSTGTEAPIVVQNDGNVNANVTVQTSAVGDGFIDSTTNDATIKYKVTNNTAAGCMAAGVASYTLMDTADFNYTGCANLAYTDSANKMEFDVELYIPLTTTPDTEFSTDITFWGTNA